MEVHAQASKNHRGEVADDQQNDQHHEEMPPLHAAILSPASPFFTSCSHTETLDPNSSSHQYCLKWVILEP